LIAGLTIFQVEQLLQIKLTPDKLSGKTI